MNIQERPALLLDLVNSRIDWPDGVRDELGDDHQARGWLRARGGTGSDEEIAGAREVRPILIDVLRADADAAALAPWAEALTRRASIVDGRLEWTLEVPDRFAVGARAVQEWDALQTPTGSRIRPCADPDCQHFLLDRSAANRRRWHSMEQCGNRSKARRHYARSRDIAEASATM